MCMNLPKSVDTQSIDLNGKTQDKTQEEIYSELLEKGYKLKEIEDLLITKNNKNAKDEIVETKININFKIPNLKDSNFVINSISVVGAIILASGIISLIASNWSEINDITKISMVIASLILFNALAIIASVKIDNSWLGQSFFLISSIVYGGAIFLTDQIFNLPLDNANSFLFWFIGVFALAIIIKSRLQEYLGIIILMFAIIDNSSLYFQYLPPSNTTNFVENTSYILIGIATIVCFIWSNSLRLEKTTEYDKNKF